MLKASCARPDDSVRFVLRALANQAKIPARTRFSRLRRIGLIDAEGNLKPRRARPTTLGKLAKSNRTSSKAK